MVVGRLTNALAPRGGMTQRFPADAVSTRQGHAHLTGEFFVKLRRSNSTGEARAAQVITATEKGVTYARAPETRRPGAH